MLLELGPKRSELVGVSDLKDRRESRLNELIINVDSRLTTKHGFVNQLASLRSELNVVSTEITELSETRSAVLAERKVLKDKIDDRESRLSNVNDEIAETVTEGERLCEGARKLQTLWRVVFDETGVRHALISKVAIPCINASLCVSASHLLGRTLQLSPLRELKGGAVRNEIDIVEGSRHTYKADSSGERDRVDLCIQFALNELAVATGRSRFGFLAIDEVLGKMDSLGARLVCEYLLERGDATVLAITHGVPLVGTRVWTAVKESGDTRIVA